MDIVKNNRQCKSVLPPELTANSSASGWMPHPAAQITIWIIVAVLSQALHGYVLVALAAFMLALSVWVCRAKLRSLLRRTRWIFISLVLIYAYATPGTACWPQLGVFSPGCEGMYDGLVQLTRLLVMLAALAILLARLSTAQLVSGLYTLTYPLRFLGISRERIAVRLALTLGYAESALRDTAQDWRASMASSINPVQTGTDSIELQLLPFTLRDWLLLVLAGAVLLGAVW